MIFPFDPTVPITFADIFVLIEAGALGASAGALVYYIHKDQKIRRRDEAMTLISQYRDSEKMQYALKILDDYNLEPKDKWKHPHGYYHKENLKKILRNHIDGPIYDHGEAEIRDSFDILLDFIGNLEPYLQSGVIKKKDVGSLMYYLKIANNNTDIQKYVDIYNFDNYKRTMKLLFDTSGHEKMP